MKKLIGFTLAEVLIVVALFAILTSVAAGVFIYHNRFYDKEAAEIFSVNETREAADRIDELGRAATEFVSSYVYSSVTYSLGPVMLVLKLPAIDGAGNIVSGQYDYAIISRNPGEANKLELIIDAAAVSSRKDRLLLLSDKLTAINFTYDSADPGLARTVTYEITAGAQTVYGSAFLRNK